MLVDDGSFRREQGEFYQIPETALASSPASGRNIAKSM